MSSLNPFFIGKPIPPEKFIGRMADISCAFDMISNRGHVAIFGSDGMGKSSFLLYLASTYSWELMQYDYSDALILYLNCLEVQPFEPSLFWREILNRLKDQFPVEISLQSQIDTELQEQNIGKDNLRRVLRKIGEQNKFLLLLLDDFDTVCQPHDNYNQTAIGKFLNEFRSLAVHSPEGRYFSTILTSCKRLNEISPTTSLSPSPWYNHYVFRPLKPFVNAEITALLSLMPSDWTLKLHEGIRELAGGHPALLQNACFLLYNIWRNLQTTDIEAFAREFESATEQYYQNAWELSTDEEKMVLMLLALSHLGGRLNHKQRYAIDGIDIIFSQLDRELRDLEGRGVVQHAIKEGKAVYNFTSSIMEWWVIKEIENCKDEVELEKRQKIFMNLSRRQVEQVRSITKQVWQHKDIVKSIVKWAGELAGAFTKGFTN